MASRFRVDLPSEFGAQNRQLLQHSNRICTLKMFGNDASRGTFVATESLPVSKFERYCKGDRRLIPASAWGRDNKENAHEVRSHYPYTDNAKGKSHLPLLSELSNSTQP